MTTQQSVVPTPAAREAGELSATIAGHVMLWSVPMLAVVLAILVR